jgi:precorrin-6B methylase 2
VSTIEQLTAQIGFDRFRELRLFLQSFGDAQNLFEPEQLMFRLRVLDELDAMIGGMDASGLESGADFGLMAHAEGLRGQLEEANEKVYRAAHDEIARCGHSALLNRWLSEIRVDEATSAGLGFDPLDEILSGVLQLREPDDTRVLLSQEMRAYQPTPARHILDLITRCGLSSEDILVDLGSGLGHVPLMVGILTGAGALGVEVQPNHAASAQRAAEHLHLEHVRFVAEDARTADISSGTVFYLFTPFDGSILTEVLDRLWTESRKRPIKICSLGPCTRALQAQRWLREMGQADIERIAIFESAAAPMQRPEASGRVDHRAPGISTG